MFEELYARGIAIGHADIKNDTVLYRYKDELFEVPTLEAHALKFLDAGENAPYGFNGYFYTAPIEELRKIGLRKEKE